jgi:hypothetical protein
MGRLIEIQSGAEELPPRLAIKTGDLLVFTATGGHVQSGGDVIEMLGAFLTGVVGNGGQILSPMGAPNTVLFLARRSGQARIDVVTGDPWHASQTTTVDLVVDS